MALEYVSLLKHVVDMSGVGFCYQNCSSFLLKLTGIETTILVQRNTMLHLMAINCHGRHHVACC